jgi:hypothetical protein
MCGQASKRKQLAEAAGASLHADGALCGDAPLLALDRMGAQ